MTDDDHFRALEGMYQSAPINAYFQPALLIEESGRARVTSDVRPQWHHAAHSAHGVVYFKMLDDAAFFAAQSQVRDQFVVTSSFQLYFTRPIVSGTLRAEGTVVSRTRTQLVAEAILYNDDKPAARGSGLFVPSRQTLGPDVGYVIHPALK